MGTTQRTADVVDFVKHSMTSDELGQIQLALTRAAAIADLVRYHGEASTYFGNDEARRERQRGTYGVEAEPLPADLDERAVAEALEAVRDDIGEVQEIIATVARRGARS